MANNLDLSASPYYDDFDPANKFIQILALPGRAEQAREFTQVQTIMLHLLRKLSSTLLKEGTIVSGMSFTQSGTDLTVQSGQIYLEGIVHDFDGETITVSNTGMEVIGITLDKLIVTEEDDISLRDPAQGFDNHGLPGAHRVKAVPKLTKNDTTSPVLFTFVDGVLQSDPVRNDTNSDLLARRTYDESGNYRVHGLQLWCQPRDTNTITLNVEAGKAYVLGYEISKTSSVKVAMDRSLDTRTVQTEPKVYLTGTNTYQLNNNPVKQITRVSATVQATATITRGGSVGGRDLLPLSPVVQIISVVQGGTTYVSGTDYQLVSDGVDWSLAGAEPSVGTSYTVVWTYNKIMVPTTDYILSYTTSGGVATYFLDFTPAGDNPVHNTQVNIDYEFYLARKDLVSLDKFGNVVITKGQSNIPSLVNTPSVSNPELLHLGTVYLAPNAPTGIPNTYAITRLSMEDLQRVSERVEQIEYNQALTDLDNQSMSGESPTALKGIFTDGFIGTTKSDLTHPSFSMAFSFEEGAIVLPASQAKVNTPTINSSTSNSKSWGRLLTADMSESVSVEQTYATGSLVINPHGVFGQTPVLRITPEVDNWIDTTSITVEKSATPLFFIHRWWYHGGDLWSETERYLFNNLSLDAGLSWQGWDVKTGTTTSSTARTVLDDSTQFIRQRVVTIVADNLLPDSDNLEAYFDGQKVILTPVSGTPTGTAAGTIKSNSSGFASGTFTIPSGIRSGTREVMIKNADNQATFPYTASGRQRVVESNVFHNRSELTPYAPVAQSFQFDKDQVISSVGLYFSAKDTKNVVVQIRNVTGGYPGQVVLAEKVVHPASINISAVGNVATIVGFDNPVYCKANTQYCVVILTSSTATALLMAELGKTNLVTGAVINRQPYVQGTLFTSSNAVAWTANQTADLKFVVNTCNFDTSSVTEFNSITSLGIDRLMLFSEYLTPQNTGCVWEVKINGGAYEPIENYRDKSLGTVINTVQLKATFVSTSKVSPAIALDALNIIGFVTTTSGSYISRNTTLAQTYTIVKQVYEAYIPSGCTVTPQFATDSTGTTWITPTSVTTSSVDGFYTRYTYTYTLGSAATNFRARLNITAGSQTDRPKARKFMNILK